MIKCTPEEAHELAGKVGRAFAEDANMLNLALLIDLAREPLQAELYRVTAGWREAFDLGIAHQDRVKALEQERDALKAELRGIDLQLNDSRLNNTMTAREAIAELQRERDALAAQVAELREALIYHQEQTRPIFQTEESLARAAPDAAEIRAGIES